MDTFIKDAIKEKLTKEAKEKISDKLGINLEDADGSIDKGLDAILGGLTQNAKDDKRAEELDAALDKDHDGSILDNVMDMLGGKSVSDDGEKILGHVFGSKKPAIESEVGKQINLDKEKASGLLSMLAPLVLGQLGKAKKDKGLDVSGLSELLSNQTKGDSGVMSLVMSFLDKDKDGSVIDDIADMLKKKL